MFDAFRARRAIEGHLQAGEEVEAIAIDDATGDYVVMTTSHLVVLKGDTITSRIPLDRIQGETTSTEATGSTLRIHDTSTGKVVIATFRRRNKLIEMLAPRRAQSLDPSDGSSDPSPDPSPDS
ncbi:MAG: hypothetical protein QOJ03_1450 [Frankiaceae bacterium]|nr:hypothetical protein [Frankiaceae bacterium]